MCRAPSVCASLPGQDQRTFSTGLPELPKHTDTFEHFYTSMPPLTTNRTHKIVCVSFMVTFWLNVSMHSGSALAVQVGQQQRTHVHVMFTAVLLYLFMQFLFSALFWMCVSLQSRWEDGNMTLLSVCSTGWQEQVSSQQWNAVVELGSSQYWSS